MFLYLYFMHFCGHFLHGDHRYDEQCQDYGIKNTTKFWKHGKNLKNKTSGNFWVELEVKFAWFELNPAFIYSEVSNIMVIMSTNWSNLSICEV